MRWIEPICASVGAYTNARYSATGTASAVTQASTFSQAGLLLLIILSLIYATNRYKHKQQVGSIVRHCGLRRIRAHGFHARTNLPSIPPRHIRIPEKRRRER